MESEKSNPPPGDDELVIRGGFGATVTLRGSLVIAGVHLLGYVEYGTAHVLVVDHWEVS